MTSFIYFISKHVSPLSQSLYLHCLIPVGSRTAFELDWHMERCLFPIRAKTNKYKLNVNRCKVQVVKPVLFLESINKCPSNCLFVNIYRIVYGQSKLYSSAESLLYMLPMIYMLAYALSYRNSQTKRNCLETWWDWWYVFKNNDVISISRFCSYFLGNIGTFSTDWKFIYS